MPLLVIEWALLTIIPRLSGSQIYNQCNLIIGKRSWSQLYFFERIV